VTLHICAAKPNYTIRLYENSQPTYQNGYAPEDEWVERKDRIYKISDPRLDVYLPQGGKAKAILLSIPGGGYRFVSSGNEGTQVADFFVPRNYAVAVLKYRLPNQHENVPLEDALQGSSFHMDGWDFVKCNYEIGI
jgi:acetyl esterase/lipase